MRKSQISRTKSSLKHLLDIPPETLDLARITAYELYREERYEEATVMVEGILAADDSDAWALSLYAAVMRNQNQLVRALELAERSLALNPRDATVRAMRDELALSHRHRRAWSAATKLHSLN